MLSNSDKIEKVVYNVMDKFYKKDSYQTKTDYEIKKHKCECTFLYWDQVQWQG